MRILLDECAPRPLKRELVDYKIRTVVEMGWSGKKNGELLRLMNQEGFTILLTTDQNLRYLLMPDVCSVLTTISPGQVIEVGGS